MIVLKRKKDESIIIGDDILFTVKEVTGMEAVVEMRAPAEMSVVYHPNAIVDDGSVHIEPEVESTKGVICPSSFVVQKNGRLEFGDQTTVIVVECRKDYVRLAIEAPPSTPIHRRVIWDAIKGEKGG